MHLRVTEPRLESGHGKDESRIAAQFCDRKRETFNHARKDVI